MRLVSRRDPSACREAERGALLIHELSSELPGGRACAQRGPAARDWRQNTSSSGGGRRASGKGFQGILGALPNSWAAGWVRDDVLSPHEQNRKNLTSYFYLTDIS